MENKAKLELSDMNDSDFKEIATLADTLLEKNFKNIKINLDNKEYLQAISTLKSLKELMKNESLKTILKDVLTDPYP